MMNQPRTEAAINLRAEQLGVDFPDGESFDVTLDRVLSDAMSVDQAVRLVAVESALCAAIDFCGLDDSDEDTYLCTRETIEALPLFQADDLGAAGFHDRIRAAREVACRLMPLATTRHGRR